MGFKRYAYQADDCTRACLLHLCSEEATALVQGNKKKTAVFTKEADRAADEPNIAFFDFRTIGGRAGDWVATVRQVSIDCMLCSLQ